MLDYFLISVLPIFSSMLAYAYRKTRPLALLIALATLVTVCLAAGRALPETRLFEVQLSFDPLSRLAFISFLVLAVVTVVYGLLAREGDGMLAVGLAVAGLTGISFSLGKDMSAAALALQFAPLVAVFGIGMDSNIRRRRTSAMRCVSHVVMAGACLIGAFSLATRFEISRDPIIEHLVYALVSIFVLIALGAFPFNLWLPKSLERGESAPFALLASVLGIGGVWLFAQAYANFPWLMLDERPVQVLMMVAALGALVTASIAATQHRLDHIIAYSVASNGGTVVVGIASGTAVGVTGGLFSLLNYLWAMLLLFVCMNMSRRQTKGEEETDGGRWTPVAIIGLGVGGLALAGAPPTAGFVGRWMVYEAGAAHSGILAVLLIGASALVFLAYARYLRSVLAGIRSSQLSADRPTGMGVLALILGVISLALGLYPMPLLQAIGEAIACMPHL